MTKSIPTSRARGSRCETAPLVANEARPTGFQAANLQKPTPSALTIFNPMPVLRIIRRGNMYHLSIWLQPIFFGRFSPTHRSRSSSFSVSFHHGLARLEEYLSVETHSQCQSWFNHLVSILVFSFRLSAPYRYTSISVNELLLSPRHVFRPVGPL